MTSVGRVAVLQDLEGFSPDVRPATFAPVRDDLASLLSGRKLLHFCSADDAGGILQNGLWPRSWCTVTPFSSYVADVWLGLPSRRDYLFVFDPEQISRYQGPGISPGFPGDALRVGGAIEFYLPDGAPATAIIHHGLLEEL